MPVLLFMLLNSSEMVLGSNLLNFKDLVQSLTAQAQSLLLLFSKEVQIVYRLFLVNCYLMQVLLNHAQLASNVGG